jgi:hypothetical protein
LLFLFELTWLEEVVLFVTTDAAGVKGAPPPPAIDVAATDSTVRDAVDN